MPCACVCWEGNNIRANEVQPRTSELSASKRSLESGYLYESLVILLANTCFMYWTDYSVARQYWTLGCAGSKEVWFCHKYSLQASNEAIRKELKDRSCKGEGTIEK